MRRALTRMAALASVVVLAGAAICACAQSADQDAEALAGQAAEAQRRGDFAAAVRAWEELNRRMPGSAEIESNLGVALYFNHAYQQSLAVLGRAETRNPKLMAPHLFAGLAWYQLGDFERAVPELKRAATLNPADALAPLWLGYAYEAQGKEAAAIAEFEAAVKADAGNVDAWYALGHAHLEAGRESAGKLIALAADGGRVWQLLGEQAELRGDAAKAEEDFRAAAKRRPDVAELRRYLVAGDSATPRASAGGAEAAGRAIARGAGKSTHAEEDRLYAVAHASEAGAREAFEQVTRLDAESYRARQIRGDLLLAQGERERAIAEYRAVLALKPEVVGIHRAIGQALAADRKPGEALKEFEAELAVNPHGAGARTDAARMLLLLGEDERAGVLLHEVLRTDHAPAEAYFLMGRWAVRRGEMATAVAALTRYVSQVQDNSDAYYLLARGLRALGRKAEAEQAMERYKATSVDARQRAAARQALAGESGRAVEGDQPE